MAQVQQLETASAVLIEANLLSNSAVDRIQYYMEILSNIIILLLLGCLMIMMIYSAVIDIPSEQQLQMFSARRVENNFIDNTTNNRKQDLEQFHVMFIVISIILILTAIGYVAVNIKSSNFLHELVADIIVFSLFGMLSCSIYIYIVFRSYNFDSLEILNVVKMDYGTNKTLTHELNAIQEEYECCGSVGPKDYHKSRYNNNTLNGKTTYDENHLYVLPESCCKVGTEKNECENSRYPTRFTSINKFINQDGCAQKLCTYRKYENKYIKSYIYIMIALQLVVLIIWLLIFFKKRSEQVLNNLVNESNRLESDTMDVQA